MPAAAVHVKRNAGLVRSARPLWGVNPPVNHGVTAAQKLGLRYESKALGHLMDSHPRAVPHIGFSYYSENTSGKRGVYFCWPDALIFSADLKIVTVVEVKRHHTIDAYWQLKSLYLPVVTAAFPGKIVRGLEVCQNFDPAIQFPCSHSLVTSAEELVSVVEGYRPAMMAVYIWTGR